MKALFNNNKLSIIIIFISIITISVLALYSNSKIDTTNTQKNYELEKEKEIYSAAYSLDSIFANLNISLKQTEIKDFIDSSSCVNCMHDNLVGDMLSDNISNEFKLAYTLNRATWAAFDEKEEVMSENYGYVVSVKRSTIKKLAKQIFDDIEVPKSISKKYYYYGVNDIVCMEESCYYSYSPWGLTGEVIDGYELKTEINKNVATTSFIYAEYGDNLTSNDVLNTLTGNITLKEEHNGLTVKQLSNYTFKKDMDAQDVNIYNEFSQYYKNSPTYIYTFENMVLKKVEKK